MRISDWSSDVCSSDLLDKDIAGRIRFSRKGEKSGFLRDYSKMKIMDLSEVHAGGAGNAPILGQYLAKIILNKDTQRFSSPDWKMIHSYLIDSCGIKANQSRLYFSIFSAGGGTGSGMASAFGRSEERRVGKEWVSTCSSRGSPYH